MSNNGAHIQKGDSTRTNFIATRKVQALGHVILHAHRQESTRWMSPMSSKGMQGGSSEASSSPTRRYELTRAQTENLSRPIRSVSNSYSSKEYICSSTKNETVGYLRHLAEPYREVPPRLKTTGCTRPTIAFDYTPATMKLLMMRALAETTCRDHLWCLGPDPDNAPFSDDGDGDDECEECLL